MEETRSGNAYDIHVDHGDNNGVLSCLVNKVVTVQLHMLRAKGSRHSHDTAAKSNL